MAKIFLSSSSKDDCVETTAMLSENSTYIPRSSLSLKRSHCHVEKDSVTCFCYKDKCNSIEEIMVEEDSSNSPIFLDFIGNCERTQRSGMCNGNVQK